MENDKLLKASDVKEYFKRVIFGADKKIDAWVDSIPAVDAVEVVRCADCKYLNENLASGGWDGSCRFWNTHSVTYSWFCSQGQRREEEHNAPD